MFYSQNHHVHQLNLDCETPATVLICNGNTAKMKHFKTTLNPGRSSHVTTHLPNAHMLETIQETSSEGVL